MRRFYFQQLFTRPGHVPEQVLGTIHLFCN